MVRILIASLIFNFFAPVTASAEILFEGYSKILSGGVHVGYIINRYEFDNNKKQFISTSFLKTNDLAGNITESLKAVANAELKPISYSYTNLMGASSKVIDAKFEKNKMTATVKEMGTVKKISKNLPKGAFLSTFLGYVILRSPQGLKPETKYEYQAIAEEDGSVEKGVAVIKSPETMNGIKYFKILNDFKGNKFISHVTDKAEVLSTKSPVQSVETELVADPSTALAQFPVSEGILKALFGGSIPVGKTNEISRLATTVQTKKDPVLESNQKGPPISVPVGKGFIPADKKAEPLEPGNNPGQ